MAVSDERRDEDELVRSVADKERRRLHARRRRREGVWFGLGMFGLVGWSVAIPMLAGVAAGAAIDAATRSRRSWTLMLMIVGLAVGCLNAWYWVSRQRRAIERERARGERDEQEERA